MSIANLKKSRSLPACLILKVFINSVKFTHKRILDVFLPNRWQIWQWRNAIEKLFIQTNEREKKQRGEKWRVDFSSQKKEGEHEHENNIIYMWKAGGSLSKQGQLQPHFHSKARSLSTTVKWSIANDSSGCYFAEFETLVVWNSLSCYSCRRYSTSVIFH